jgi:Uma2 family endonuclease
MASLPDSPLTEEEYLQIERLAETKSEYHDGRMYAMSGGSPRHALLANNIGAILRGQMPPGCHTYNSDLRIKVARAEVFTYADCSVICGELQYAGDRKDVVLNPILIVEVLSPSTEAYDRGKKFQLYRTIPSLREYLLIAQDERHVEQYSKQNAEGWLFREYRSGIVTIPSLKDLRIALEELYESVVDSVD